MNKDPLKILPHYLFPKQLMTRFAGVIADVKTPFIKNYLITHFIKQYQVNMQEALEEDATQYATFNDFFIRTLKPDVRPLSSADIVSPVDGTVSEIGRIEKGRLIQAKGKDYHVEEFLASEDTLSHQFLNGQFTTLYLSPKDYHRIHMPYAARLKKMVYVPGKLFSVQPLTTRMIPKLFARNERLVVFFDTDVGLMAMVLVGATIVGSIGTSWAGEIQRSQHKQYFDYEEENALLLQKGQEMGYFKLGSTVVLMFANGNKIQWMEDIQAGHTIQYGQALGKVIS